MIVNPSPIFDSPIVRSLLNAFEHSMFSFTITDADDGPNGHQFLFVNQAFIKQTGYVEKDLIGQSPRILQGPKTDRNLLDNLKQTIYASKTFIGQTVNYRKDGSEYIVRWSINPIKDESGKIIGFISCQMEVSQQIKEHELMAILSEALNQTADSAMVTDLSGHIIYVNRALCKMTGYEKHELEGQHTRIFSSGKMPLEFYQDLWRSLIENRPFEGVFINKNKQGQSYFEHKTITPILDEFNRAMYYLAISRDSTEIIERTEHLSFKAFHDELTGLPNRSKFNEIVRAKLKRYEQHDIEFSLIVGDIDNFKQLNDQYGHDFGDQVLKQVAQQLSDSVRRDDLVARWGGEEFVIVIDSNLKGARKLANYLVNKMAELEVERVPSNCVSLSFGYASVKANETLEQLFERADQGLYQAKQTGKNRACSIEN